MLARDERAHLDAVLEAVADLDLRQPQLDRLDEPVARVADGDDLRDRHAALAGRAVGGADRRVGGQVDVGVGEDDHVVLRPAERLHALAVLRPGLVDVARDRRRADEADRSDVRVLEDRVDSDLVAVDDVEDAVGQAGLLEQLGGPDRRGRILLGGLEHERVPAGERRRPHPHRDHRGEVEGRDPGDDAERLPDRVDVDPGRGLLGHAALEQVRDPAGELDHLEPARDLAHRVGEHLAVLGGEDPRGLLAALVHELADPEEQLRALRERRGAPGRERRLRGRDRGADLLGRREIDLARLLPERRVEHRPGPARSPLDGLAADPVADPGESFALLGGRGRQLGHLGLLR